MARRWKRWTPEEDALLGTQPDVDIAARIDRSVDSVSLRRQALKLPPSPTERRSSAKLTQRQIDEIRRSRATQATLAARYGVTQATISRVRDPRTPRRDVPRRR